MRSLVIFIFFMWPFILYVWFYHFFLAQSGKYFNEGGSRAKALRYFFYLGRRATIILKFL